ncbi:MAG TPA: alpha-amylase family glycosyl hydrolase, partial [Bacteroidales bacterium]|nr:alpha-amylase family glycosyl hydrolase [Bacteroidales bacterium]
GLEAKLPYLRDLGVNCLWLLPILDSPMRDAGFDIRRYDRIRPSLFSLPEDADDVLIHGRFTDFLKAAHTLGIRVIFDVAMNHTSEEHPWFQQSRSSEDNPFRSYYIWNHDDSKYSGARLLFKGMCPSNWEKDGEGYFFHRFFEFQPDLNYRDPRVLVEISRVLLHWLASGVDGFRVDAIPYLWKEEGTNCENLPETHLIVKFFRSVVDLVCPGTLLLAEACQPPNEVVKYFGEGDECHAGYHFPIMPQIFKALALGSALPVKATLSPEVTPDIAPGNQWFMFLRLHDELTLEMVSPEDRAIIHGHYCRDPRWDFRVGEGISARLAELLEFDMRRIRLAYSIMFTLPGTPIIYYGDEFARGNDERYYEEVKALTGYNDTRYFVRGPIRWNETEALLADPSSLGSQVFQTLKEMIHVRSGHPAFGRGSLEWMEISNPSGIPLPEVLAYRRTLENDEVIVIQNMGPQPITCDLTPFEGYRDLLASDLPFSPGPAAQLAPYEIHWLWK